MPDLIHIFSRWWKMIAGVTLLSVAIAFVVILLLPKKYLSIATAFPVNSASTDKGSIFNENIQSLYSLFGGADELDKFEGTAKLDTIYIATVKQHDLISHYNLSHEKYPLENAVRLLKKNVDISKTPFGQLRVKAWDKDRILAAALANTLMKEIQQLHQRMLQVSSEHVLNNLVTTAGEIQDQVKAMDTTEMNAPIHTIRRVSLLEQLQQHEKLIGEYRLLARSGAPLLMIAEPARPSAWADKPDRLQILVFSFFAAFLFSFLMAVFLQSGTR